MKLLVVLITLFIALTSAAPAQDLPEEGRIYQSKSIDFDGDGRMEKVVLVAYGIHREAESYFGRLKVLDASGKVLWAARTAEHADEPFAFGSWPYGGSEIEWLGDIDGDGKIELLSPLPVSDLRPPTYRFYRWDGSKFVPLASKMLLSDDHELFGWRKPIDWDGVKPVTWIARLDAEPGTTMATITSYTRDGQVLGGRALVEGTKDGLRVTKWLNELESL